MGGVRPSKEQTFRSYMSMTKADLITLYRAQFKHFKNKKISLLMTKEQIVTKLMKDSRSW